MSGFLRIPQAVYNHPEVGCCEVACYLSILEAVDRFGGPDRLPGEVSNSELLEASPWTKWETLDRWRKRLKRLDLVEWIPGTGTRGTVYRLGQSDGVSLAMDEELSGPARGRRVLPYYQAPRGLMLEEGVRPVHLCLYLAVYSFADWSSSPPEARVSTALVMRRAHISHWRTFTDARDWIEARGYLSRSVTRHRRDITLWVLNQTPPALDSRGSPRFSFFNRGGSPRTANENPGDPRMPQAADSPESKPGPSPERQARGTPEVKDRSGESTDDQSFSTGDRAHRVLEALRRSGLWEGLPQVLRDSAAALAESYPEEVVVEAVRRVSLRRLSPEPISSPASYLARVAASLAEGGPPEHVVRRHFERLAESDGSDPPPPWVGEMRRRHPGLARWYDWRFSQDGRAATPERRLAAIDWFAAGNTGDPPRGDDEECRHGVYARFPDLVSGKEMRRCVRCGLEWEAEEAAPRGHGR